MSSFMTMLRAWLLSGGVILQAHFGSSPSVTPSPTKLFVPLKQKKSTLKESTLALLIRRADHEESTTSTLWLID